MRVLGIIDLFFYFNHEEDKRRILVDNSLLLLIEPKRIEDIFTLEFNRTTFWTQIHNIPIICVNEESVWTIGRRIGTVKEIDLRATEDCLGKFIRI